MHDFAFSNIRGQPNLCAFIYMALVAGYFLSYELSNKTVNDLCIVDVLQYSCFICVL